MTGWIGRRSLLIAACGAPLAAVGLVSVFTMNHGQVARLIRKAAPDAVIPDETIDAFLRQRKAGGASVTTPEPWSWTHSTEREIVTAFLMGSSFFRRGYKPEDPVVWIDEPDLCTNPLARF